MVLIGDSLTVNSRRYTVAGRCFINGWGQRCPVIGSEYLWLLSYVNKRSEGLMYLVQRLPRRFTTARKQEK